MSVNEVRRYARQTASELVNAGTPRESLVDRGGVEQMRGWPVWGQVLHIEIYKDRDDPVGHGESERAEIWLRPDGTLMDVRLVVGIWPGTLPDRLEDFSEASDHCIGWADVAVNQWLREPTVPPGRYGLFESAVTLRAVADPGNAVLQGLEGLRSTSLAGGTTQLCLEARQRASASRAFAARNAGVVAPPRSGRSSALTRWSFAMALLGVCTAAIIALIANVPGFSGKPGFAASLLFAVIGWGVFQAAITVSVASRAKTIGDVDRGLAIALAWGWISATTATFLMASSASRGEVTSTAWLMWWFLVATVVGLVGSRWAFRAGSRS